MHPDRTDIANLFLIVLILAGLALLPAHAGAAPATAPAPTTIDPSNPPNLCNSPSPSPALTCSPAPAEKPSCGCSNKGTVVCQRGAQPTKFMKFYCHLTH